LGFGKKRLVRESKNKKLWPKL